MSSKIGDAPRFPLTAQRLDKSDLTDLSRLLEETILRQVGQLLGDVGGLASRVVVTYSAAAATLTLGPCRFYGAHFAAGSPELTDGGFFEFRPELSPSNGVVPIGALGGNDGYLFFKRQVVAADEENRAYYDALTQTKKVGLALTRDREVIEIVAHNSYSGYARSSGYYPFLRVESNPEDTRPIFYWDGFDEAATSLGHGVMFNYGELRRGLGIRTSSTTFTLTLPRLLHFIVGSIQHLYSSDFKLSTEGAIISTTSVPNRWAGFELNRGVVQLERSLAAVERMANLYTLEVIAGNVKRNESSLHGTRPITTLGHATGVARIDFIDDRFGCSSTINPCVINITFRLTPGFCYYRWVTEYVLEIVRTNPNGVLSDFGFSLLIIRSAT